MPKIVNALSWVVPSWNYIGDYLLTVILIWMWIAMVMVMVV